MSHDAIRRVAGVESGDACVWCGRPLDPGDRAWTADDWEMWVACCKLHAERYVAKIDDETDREVMGRL